jgi:hypothetical protein
LPRSGSRVRISSFALNTFYTRMYVVINQNNNCWIDYAQMVELVDTQDLKSCDLKSRAGSIPALSTTRDFNIETGYLHTNAKVAQLVEHDLAKVGVASSNLVFRSKSLQLEGFFLLISSVIADKNLT